MARFLNLLSKLKLTESLIAKKLWVQWTLVVGTAIINYHFGGHICPLAKECKFEDCNINLLLYFF